MPHEPLLTRSFLLASAAHFLYALSFYLFLHLPGFLKGLGATELGIGLLSGVTGATAIAARPIMGRVMDTRGRRVVILAGGTLGTIVCASYLSLGRLDAWVLLVRVGHGVSEAMLFASLFAFASDIIPPSRRIEGIALFGVSGLLPMSFGGLLGDAILARGTYAHLFVAATMLAFGALLTSLPLRESLRRAGGPPPRGMLVALVQRDLLPLWFAGMLFATSLAGQFTFLKTYVMAKGIGSVGLFFTTYSVAATLLRVAFGSLPERVGPKRVLVPAMLSIGVGSLLLAVAASSWHVTLAGLFCGVGHGFTFPILLGLVVTRARASERGAALSLFTALFDAGMLVGGPALGAIVRLSGYSAMFATASGLVTFAAVGYAYWDRGRS